MDQSKSVLRSLYSRIYRKREKQETKDKSKKKLLLAESQKSLIFERHGNRNAVEAEKANIKESW